MRRRQNQAATEARIADGQLAHTEAELDEMEAGPGRFGTARKLVDRAKNMFERVKRRYPDGKSVGLDASHDWQPGQTKTQLAQGGGQAAAGKLKGHLADRMRPWWHGAQQFLAGAEQAE